MKARVDWGWVGGNPAKRDWSSPAARQALADNKAREAMRLFNITERKSQAVAGVNSVASRIMGA